MNPIISIAIPTFNRADFLNKTLEHHIPLLAQYSIPIIIRDNASTDETSSIANHWLKKYPFIRYIRNAENLGPDKNFELALKDAQTEYVWLLGDTYKINDAQLKLIIEMAETAKPDFYVLNVINRVQNLPSKTYTECNAVLADIGWHMTCMASLIYRTSNINLLQFSRYYNCNFLQLGIILEFIARQPFKLLWITEQSVEGLTIPGIKKISWMEEAFDIWIERWVNFICSLPVLYKMENKLAAIKDHGEKSGLFTIKGLLILRAKNIFTLKTLLKHHKLFTMAVPTNILVAFFISIIPVRILKMKIKK